MNWSPRNQEYDAYIRFGCSQFSSFIVNHTDLDQCREQAKTIAKNRLAESPLGCCEITIKRRRAVRMFDNLIDSIFVVLK